MTTSLFSELARIEKEKLSASLCTIVRSSGATPRHAGSKMLVFHDGKIIGSVGGGELENRVISESKKAIKDNQPRLIKYSFIDPQRGDVGVCGGEAEVFIDPINPKPTILVIGCGHVGKAVAHLAKWLGFNVAVSDDRTELCNPENILDANLYLPCAMSDIPEKMDINQTTFIILTTRGSEVDIEGLPFLIDKDYAYLGIIGSQRRWEITKKALVKSGIKRESIDKVHSPIGLEIHAETPEEIAVSILSQIVLLRNNGSNLITTIA